MRVLAIECATEACSVALYDGSNLVEHFHEEIGRGHAERLIPAIEDLPGNGHADRILVSLGPGSFTGVRIGLAAARALGLAWQAEVLGYPTMALVAARGWQPAPRAVTVCMSGGHGEWFVQNFSDNFTADDEVRSLKPEAAATACQHSIIVGNRATHLAELLGDSRTAMELMPDARQTFLLPPTYITNDLSPIYGRAPDAKLPKARKP